nr:hypothetical protein [Tanacetum cinerariifolium]
MSHDPQESVLEEEEEHDENDDDEENDVENEEVEYVQMATTTRDRGRGKNKQYWNEEEVEVLIDFCKNLLVILYGRNKYNPLSEMLMQSGCQWDDVENKLNCEKQWYDDWCKTYKNANGLWNFKFPYLYKLDTVWGKDRATSLKAEDIAKACEDNNKSSHKKKKTLTLEQTIDAKLDGFSFDFKSVYGQMTSKISVVADALAVDANKSESMSEDKMQEVMNILITMGISHFDVGKVVEFCYNDPTKRFRGPLAASYYEASEAVSEADGEADSEANVGVDILVDIDVDTETEIDSDVLVDIKADITVEAAAAI